MNVRFSVRSSRVSLHANVIGVTRMEPKELACGYSGVDPDKVKLASRSRKGCWRLSNNSLVRVALNDDYLKTQGVRSLRNLWAVFKFGDKARLT